jgi:hypothetical protein
VERPDDRRAEGSERESHLEHDHAEHDPRPLPALRDGLRREEGQDQEDQAEQRDDHHADHAVQHVADVALVVPVDDRAGVDGGESVEPAEGDGRRLHEHTERDEAGQDTVGLLQVVPPGCSSGPP